MPTSVLLAVLAAAGLLALAPALVRRYDATERLVAERAQSTARVVTRVGARRLRARRTVPGRRPVNPPRPRTAQPDPSGGDAGSGALDGTAASTPAGQPGAVDTRAGRPLHPVSAVPASVGRLGSGGGREAERRGQPDPRRMAAARRKKAGHSRAVYRRRRVLLALVLLNIVETVGVIFVGPGFWISGALSGSLLLMYLVHLRNRALLDRRRRRAEARYAAWLTARQAAVRREQARRAAARRVALEQQLAERDRVRREAARLASLRGRPYSSRAVGL